MIVAATLCVALSPPPANIAMAHRPRVRSIWRGVYGRLQRSLDDAIIGGEGRKPIVFGFEINTRPNDVKEFRNRPGRPRSM
jgi:hypothetical protein